MGPNQRRGLAGAPMYWLCTRVVSSKAVPIPQFLTSLAGAGFTAAASTSRVLFAACRSHPVTQIAAYDQRGLVAGALLRALRGIWMSEAGMIVVGVVAPPTQTRLVCFRRSSAPLRCWPFLRLGVEGMTKWCGKSVFCGCNASLFVICLLLFSLLAPASPEGLLDDNAEQVQSWIAAKPHCQSDNDVVARVSTARIITTCEILLPGYPGALRIALSHFSMTASVAYALRGLHRRKRVSHARPPLVTLWHADAMTLQSRRIFSF